MALPDKVQQYLRFEVVIPDLSAPLTGELGVAAGNVTLNPAELGLLQQHGGSIGLTLLTADGSRRAVQLR